MMDARYALPDAPEGLDPHEALDLALSLLVFADEHGATDPENIPLAFPIQTKAKDGSVLSEVKTASVRRPKVKDYRSPKVLHAKNEMEAGIEMGKLLTGMPDHIFDALDGVDFERIGNVIAGFQEHSPTTGSSVE